MKGCGDLNSYLSRLKAYIQEHPLSFEESVGFPALDTLWWHFSQFHSIQSEKTEQGYHDLYPLLAPLGPEVEDKVISAVGCLCAEHERIAFMAGLQLGAQLMLELTGDGVCEE